MVHNLPLINMILALTILQITVTWFGREVCWKALKHSSHYTKKRRIVFTHVCLIAVILASIFKIIHQISALATVSIHNTQTNLTTPGNETNVGQILRNETYDGIWVNFNDNKGILFAVNILWLIGAMIGPMIHSGYLAFKSFDTHLIIVTVEDNRPANAEDSSS